MRTKRQGLGIGATFSAAALAALAVILLAPATARAQWTGPDTNGNVNTATGVNNVGVGAANPAEKLTVAGSIVATGSSAIQGSQFIITNNDTTGPWMGVHTDRLGNSTANYAAPRLSMQAAGMFFQTSPAIGAGSARTWTTRLAISGSNGNVGIGTSSPGALLDVRGSIALDGTVPAAHAATNYSSLWLKNNVALISEVYPGYSVVTLGANYQRSTGGWTNVDTSIPTWSLSLGAGSGYDMFELNHSPAGTYNRSTFMVVNSSGNVGIGVPTPGAGLDVQTAVPATAAPTAYGVRLQQTLNSGPNNSVQTGLYINPTFNDGVAVGNTHNALATGAGNVGIGTTATTAGLDVRNAGVISGAASYGVRLQQTIPAATNNALSTALYINPTFSDGMAVGVKHNGLVVAAGDVGIGTSNPDTYGDGGTANYLALQAAGTNQHAQIAVAGTGAGNGQIVFGNSTVRRAVIAAVDGSHLLFYVNNANSGAAALEAMRITSGGKVGVGTASPAAKLDVNAGSNAAAAINVTGAINATGAITGATVSATYQDVAEWVPSTQKLRAGTVVVLDTDKTNHVLASTKSYDTKVAGVISEAPGVILGVGGDEKLKVATTGRVKVKADATRAAIKVGDLLVTSDVEGVAMKSVEVDLGGVKLHRPGTIIGKALEPLASGTGEILVLLSLQ